MMKLVNYIAHKERQKEQQKEIKSRIKKEKEDAAGEALRLELTEVDKKEIRATISKVQGSEIHAILMRQLALHELDLAKLDVPVEEEEEEDSGAYSSGTFCVKNIKKPSESTPQPEPEPAQSDDAYGTFCIKSTSKSTSSIPSFVSAAVSADSATSVSASSSNLPAAVPTNSADGKRKKGSRRNSPAAIAAEKPMDFKQYREPENWEKCILSLEKGEWTEEMAENACFKRWKKERPAMPSLYIKNST